MNNSNRRATTNTVLLICLRVLMPVLSVALILAISRFLGPAGLGRYTLALSMLYVINAIAPLGLSAIVTRECARDPAQLDVVLRSALKLSTIASLICIPIMIASGFVLNYDDETRLGLMVLSAGVIPFTVGTMVESALVAKERIDFLAISACVENVLKVGLGVALLATGFGVVSVLVMVVLGRVAFCFTSIYYLRRLGIKLSRGNDPQIGKQLLKLAPTFFLIGIFATLYWRIDIFMLSSLKSVEDVGFYGAAYRLHELAMIFPQSLCLAIYPQIVSATQNNLSALDSLGKTSSRYLAAIGLPVVICTILLASPILTALYGESFRVAAPTLAVLIFTLLPYSIVRYHAYILVGANRQRIDLYLNIIMAAINIALNLILIPKYSYFGAAVATLVAVCFYAIIQYGYIRVYLPRYAAPISVKGVVLASSAIVGLGAWMLRDINVIGVTIAAGFAYLSLLYIGGFFSKTELQMFGIGRLIDRLGIR